MARISEEYLKILEDLNKNIKDEEERKYVVKKFSEMSALYLDVIDRISEMGTKRVEELEDYQGKLEKKISKLADSVNLIKNDIYEEDSYDFEIVCPYCNHEFVADINSEENAEVECPECHNIIELDWNEEEGCGGYCSHCDGCGDEEDDDDDSEHDENDNDEDM